MEGVHNKGLVAWLELYQKAISDMFAKISNDSGEYSPGTMNFAMMCKVIKIIGERTQKYAEALMGASLNEITEKLFAQVKEIGMLLGQFVDDATFEQNALFHCKTACALERAGLRSDALREYGIASKLAPDDASLHSSYCVSLISHKRYDEALVESRRANELAPDDATHLNNLAAALYFKAQYRDALAVSEKAVSLAPLFDRPYIYRGLCKIKLGLADSGGAEADLTQAVSLLPENARNLRDRSRGYILLGKLHEANGDLKKAVGMDKNDPEIWFLASILNIRNGFIEAAGDCYNHAKKLGYIDEPEPEDDGNEDRIRISANNGSVTNARIISPIEIMGGNKYLFYTLDETLSNGDLLIYARKMEASKSADKIDGAEWERLKAIMNDIIAGASGFNREYTFFRLFDSIGSDT